MDSHGGQSQLRDDRAVRLAAPDRQDVEQRLAGQDHAGRVHAGLADQALEAPGGVDDLLHVGSDSYSARNSAGLPVARVLRVEDAGQRDVLAHHRPAASPW